jgi:hypothetical protein
MNEFENTQKGIDHLSTIVESERFEDIKQLITSKQVTQ